MNTIIFDWKRTLYNPESKQLINGAYDILDYLKNTNTKLVLVGKGKNDMYDEVIRLGIDGYFTNIYFSEWAKEESIFDEYVDKSAPEKTIFIGDRVRSELTVGNKMGATTIWVKQGKFANEEPETPEQQPNYTVGSLNEAIAVISKII